MSKLTTLDHLRSLAEASKAFTGGLFSTLAENVVDAILEERGTSVPIVLASSGWQKSGAAENTAYPYSYLYPLADVTAQDRVDVTLSPSSLGTAAACGLCPTCETGSGTVTFRAASVPGESIRGEYRLLKGKES